ncbi:FAD-dependent oxidoreductase [Glutamicibacter mishrai]|uniref:FAD-dependent oxidoreductase n=1 Tax=Glutamicibacter mishrai TaxID=1775880 RepID=A0A6H0SGM1_9MICC|nr:FAD-dependent oxidoreductase [Glutamicibacter mishrai]QIV85691.1 FAD-dependent oxidoreductase [Glutamicibacter mishrai]UTT38237.1 FAD-dependent oxidoreductase [Glutamicibacter mishrai]
MKSTTGCIVVGGGPAGMVAGLLLARCGVSVTVLEKHSDFLRDFRGDTIHPSTLQLLDELGLMEQFEQIQFNKVSQAQFPAQDNSPVTVVDLSKLHHPYPFIALAPQWDFLDLLARAGEAEENFTLRMNCEVTDVLSDLGKIVGVQYTGPDGEHEIRADLTIAADGRWSRIRDSAGIAMKDYSVPIDVWWFKVPGALKREFTLSPAFVNGRMFVLIPRTGYVQTAMILPKGMDTELRAMGVDAWHDSIISAAPELAGSVAGLKLDDAKLLDVKLNRARKWWQPGLLCIGDSAHAMSPVGGVGVNLAVQDAVATARLLAEPLRESKLTEQHLAKVQFRRTVPTLVVQGMQRVMHRGLKQVLKVKGEIILPDPIAMIFRRFPRLSAVPARLLGVGVLRERPPARARRN